MVQVGDRVKIHRDGKSVFLVASVDDGRGVVEAVGSAPGIYPFSCDLASLVLVDFDGESSEPAQ
jgi:hypothetical protein